MAISRYITPFRKISVVTFVRLGDGAPTTHNVFDPIEVKPFAISMDLGYGEYQVPRWGHNEKPQWNEEWARDHFYKTKSDEQLSL